MLFACFGAASLWLATGARADEAAVARGHYLAILGDCAGCHTLPHAPAFAGGLGFNAPFGTIYSTNITPDRQTGIGNWSEEDFCRALHDGIAPGGKHLYPAFPYIYFNRITPQETSDLFAYLRTLAPVRRRRDAQQADVSFQSALRDFILELALSRQDPVRDCPPTPARRGSAANIW